ncbi:MAG: hypothetical protein IT320_16640 [Anaerolineae bacterium]|nr:hypothetical protein [Anaerolineae bacterium]
MRRKSRHGLLKLLVLVAIVVALGFALEQQGDLISPLQSTTLLMSLNSDEAGFAPDGDAPALQADAESAAVTTDSAAQVSDDSTTATTTEAMTIETFTAELAAAGVDVEAVSASMSAEGRSLDNLLAVVNSGRVTVAELAARLNGETASTENSAPAPSSESDSLFNIHWEDFGSVLYDLWVILAATVIVIVLSRPASWLKNRLRRTATA